MLWQGYEAYVGANGVSVKQVSVVGLVVVWKLEYSVEYIKGVVLVLIRSNFELNVMLWHPK